MRLTVNRTLLLGTLALGAVVGVWLFNRPKRPHALPTALRQISPSNVALSRSPGSVVASRASIPASVEPIVTEVPASTYPDRVAKLRALPANPTTEEVDALYAYLRVPAPPGALYRPAENWLRNEMLDKLTGASPLPPSLVRMLGAIYQDPKQDVVVRDYAVQHIAPIYARATPDEKATLQQILWAAVQETDSSIAGTALLGLRDLAQIQGGPDRDRVAQVALKLARDGHCGELSRITALQLCGRMDIAEASPTLLELAQSANTVPLKIAAIAALGDVGNAQAEDYLRELATHPDPRMRPALDLALRKLNRRLGG